MIEFKLNKENPCPFVQPFLMLTLKQKNRDGSNIVWHIDVNGEMEKYLIGGDPHEGSHVNLIANATDLLKEMIGQLAENGMHVARASTYTGSAGPSFVLRNGALFRCTNLDEILYLERRE